MSVFLCITILVLPVILDNLNNKNKDYDSVETYDFGNVEISNTASGETGGPLYVAVNRLVVMVIRRYSGY